MVWVAKPVVRPMGFGILARIGRGLMPIDALQRVMV